jgi:hypothetical protein
MNDEFAEVIELAEKAQSRGVFSLADAIKGKANPSDDVEVYLDAESAYRLTKLNDQLIQTLDEDLIKDLESQAAELVEKIQASKVIFHMRGIDQALVEKLEESVKAKYPEGSEDWWREYLCALAASNIVSVEDANGNVDEHLFTTEELIEIRNSIPGESWETIISTMQRLTLATGYFKGLTDAGFLQKS